MKEKIGTKVTMLERTSIDKLWSLGLTPAEIKNITGRSYSTLYRCRSPWAVQQRIKFLNQQEDTVVVNDKRQTVTEEEIRKIWELVHEEKKSVRDACKETNRSYGTCHSYSYGNKAHVAQQLVNQHKQPVVPGTMSKAHTPATMSMTQAPAVKTSEVLEANSETVEPQSETTPALENMELVALAEEMKKTSETLLFAEFQKALANSNCVYFEGKDSVQDLQRLYTDFKTKWLSKHPPLSTIKSLMTDDTSSD